jgi:ring-1,2-phenylacetyl-CoA epoxidase subunit PaaE
MLSSSIDTETVEPKSRYFHPLKVRAIKPETRDAITLTFDVPAELSGTFRFVQGQYVTVRATINGEEIRRSYSICSAVQDGILRVGIKRAPGGLFSNWIMENVKPGSFLDVAPPEGRVHVE